MPLQLPTFVEQAMPDTAGNVGSPQFGIGRPSVQRQAGQALIETLIFAMAAAIALFGVLLIGRLHAIQASTIGAARAHAFECRLEVAGCDDSVRATELAAAVRSRHFASASGSSSGRPERSASGASTAGVPHAFWTNPDGSRMVDSLPSISVSASTLSLNAGVNVATAAGRMGNASGGFSIPGGPQQFGLDATAGFRASSIEVPVRASLSGAAGPSDQSPLAIKVRARLAIVGGEWNASQSFGVVADSVQSRVERGSRLDPFREAALEAGYAIPRALLRAADALGLEPGGAALASHRLDVTVVPQDRRP